MRLSRPFLGPGDHFRQSYEEKTSSITTVDQLGDPRRFMSPDVGCRIRASWMSRWRWLVGGAVGAMDGRWTAGPAKSAGAGMLAGCSYCGALGHAAEACRFAPSGGRGDAVDCLDGHFGEPEPQSESAARGGGDTAGRGGPFAAHPTPDRASCETTVVESLPTRDPGSHATWVVKSLRRRVVYYYTIFVVGSLYMKLYEAAPGE
jgi:hypothetical protein